MAPKFWQLFGGFPGIACGLGSSPGRLSPSACCPQGRGWHPQGDSRGDNS